MRRRGKVEPFDFARLETLRSLARRDARVSLLLAPELLRGANELVEDSRIEEALELLEELVGWMDTWPEDGRDNPLTVALATIGTLHRHDGRIVEAEAALRRVDDLKPTSARARTAQRAARRALKRISRS